MKSNNSIINHLNRSKWDNTLFAVLMIFLGGVGTAGVVTTLSSDIGNNNPLPHQMVTRRPPARRRREFTNEDSTGTGIKTNSLVSAY